MDPNQIASSIRTLSERQVRVVTGTVVGDSPNPETIPVRLDNDPMNTGSTTPVTIPSLLGTIPVDTRVAILVQPPAGMLIIGIVNAPYDLIDLWNFVLQYVQPVVLNPVWMERRFYTSNDTWNKPTSALFLGVVARVQGGGGGSGGTAAVTAAQTSSSAGGQGGGYAAAIILAQNLTSTVSVTVGAGGAAAAAGNNAGGDGGTSSFGAYLSVAGGEGGAGGGSASTNQTTQAAGDANHWTSLSVTGGAVLLDFAQGSDGTTGFRYADQIIWPGAGGASRMAGASRVQTLASGQIAPAAGWLFGGGASGRGSNGQQAGGAIGAGGGSAGAQGCVIIEEIYRT